MSIKAGSTNVTRYVQLVTTAGAPATGLTITDLDLQYTRRGAAPSTKADATALAAADSAHTDNAMFEVDATNSPGLYRVDWPDAAFAEGVGDVQLVVNGTGIQPAVEEVQIEALLYWAKIRLQINDVDGEDIWLVNWMEGSSSVQSESISSPTIQARDPDDATLLDQRTMTLVGSGHDTYKYVATATSGAGPSNERTTAGVPVSVKVAATIGGSTRIWEELFGRDG